MAIVAAVVVFFTQQGGHKPSPAPTGPPQVDLGAILLGPQT
jgi:hypothetical protein